MRAWAHALAKIHILSVTEFEDAESALAEICDRIVNDPPAALDFDPRAIRERLNREITNRPGVSLDKITQGMSARERDVTVFRLWMLDAGRAMRESIQSCADALARLARRSRNYVIMPKTLQLEEPTLFGHWILSRMDMFARDALRVRDILDRCDECALGSGDGAGCALPIEREELAAELGFLRASENALDAVQNLEFAWELASAANIILTHTAEIDALEEILPSEAASRRSTRAAAPETPRPEAAAAKTYFFDIMTNTICKLDDAAAWIGTIEVRGRLTPLDRAEEAVRNSILNKKAQGGTAPEIVDRRIAVSRAGADPAE